MSLIQSRGAVLTPLFVVTSLVFTGPAFGAMGDTIQGFISTPGQVDTYSFSATAGDRPLIRMVSVMSPWVGIYSPGNDLLCESLTWFGDWHAEIVDCRLPVNGTYFVRASAIDMSETGGYSLYMQMLNRPSLTTPINPGQMISASIDTEAKLDTYTFTATAGDRPIVGMASDFSEESNCLNPQIRVFGPDGILICTAPAFYDPYTVSAQIIDCTLPASGTYTLLAGDYYGAGIGNYSIALEMFGSDVFDSFEHYPLGMEATSGWGLWIPGEKPYGLDDTIHFSGNYSLRINGDWSLYTGAFRRPLNSAPPFTIDIHVYNGSGSSDLGDFQRATLALRSPDGFGPGRKLISFDSDGNIRGSSEITERFSGTVLGTFRTEEWIGVKVGYEVLSPSTARLTYLINDQPAWSEILPVFAYENDLRYLQLHAGGGLVWFDHLMMKAGIVAGPRLSIMPSSGGSGGRVTAEIFGAGFREGTAVKLARAGQEVSGGSVSIVAPDKMTATFDLAGAPPGEWDLAVTLPDDTRLTCVNCFTVADGGEARLWVDLLGAERVRVGRESTFQLLYGNSGNIDNASDALLYVSLPKEVGLRLELPHNEATTYLEPDSPGDETMTSFLVDLSTLGPGTTGRIPVHLIAQSTSSFHLKASVLTVPTPYRPLGGAGVPATELLPGAICTYDKVHIPGHPKFFGWEHMVVYMGEISGKRQYAEQYIGVKNDPNDPHGDGGLQQTDEDILSGRGGDLVACFNPPTGSMGTAAVAEIQRLLEDIRAEAVKGNDISKYDPDSERLVLKNIQGYPSEQAGDKDVLQGACTDPPYHLARNIFAYAEKEIIRKYVCRANGKLDIKYDAGSITKGLAGLAERGSGSIYGGTYDKVLENKGKPHNIGSALCEPNAVLDAVDKLIHAVISLDPNDKSGPAGTGSERFVPAGRSLAYRIDFENLEAATAAAQEVLVKDQLDANLDWSTFALTAVQIGTRAVSVPAGAQSLLTTVDLRPETAALVDVNCTYAPVEGNLVCLLRGKNPDTGELADFLPPNGQSIDPRGRGWISYSVRPKTGLPTGTVIRNSATIDFEVDIPPEPMETPEVFNTVDSVAPASGIIALPAVEDAPEYTVMWGGSDDLGGSGVRNYDVYVSDNGGPYVLWTTSSSTSATFTGQRGHRYSFYSRARDNVGNLEAPKTVADTGTLVALAKRFASTGAQDGWILESTEHSGRGGTLNARAATIRLGDDKSDRQYRGVLSFDTSGLPDNAVISGAALSVKKQGIVGAGPFGTHGELLGDIIRGSFSGQAALQLSDFQAAPSLRAGVSSFVEQPGGWYSATLSAAARSSVNKRGRTQLKLRFKRDDNEDRGADYLEIYSGNAAAELGPVLEVMYTVP